MKDSAKDKRADRQEILNYAQYLIREGTSRRKMDTILREKFGHSIGHPTHQRIYQERVRTIRERETARPKGYRKPRNQKEINYNKLIALRFLPEEAKELASRLKTLKYHEVEIMSSQRRKLWNGYVRKAASAGLNREEFREGWERAVNNWYRQIVVRWRKEFVRWHMHRGHDVEKRKKWNLKDLIWSWFGHVKKNLPPEMQSETPRKHRAKRQRPVTADRIRRSEHINNLQAQIDKTNDPEMKKWLKELIEKERAR